jgi:hypothetical protein
MVQQCGGPFLLSLCCSLSYTFKPLGHAFPAQCPARVLLVRVSLGSLATACAAFPAFAHEGHESEAAEEIAVTGEVVNMACYIDHNATGPKHADCAQTCIKMGLPVGIKANDGKTYLLIGEHKPINSELASLAAKTIAVKGKLVSRDGFKMIENVEIVKK